MKRKRNCSRWKACRAKALVHPVRAQILAIASWRLISPAEFAMASGESLDRARYHFKQLAHYGGLELIDIKLAEGSVKQYYRATACAIEEGLALEGKGR